MAHTYKLVEANTSKEINLAYNASTNPNWLVNTGSPSLSSPVTPKFHKPDNAPPEIIDLVADIRSMSFSMIVQGDDSDPDDLLNNISVLSRWVDGPDQQATRFWRFGDVNQIELHIKLDGATNTTKIPVVYGNVSAFDSLFTEYGSVNTIAYGAIVQLYLAPYGEGDPITLRNDLASSPGMVEDSNSDGLMDGLTLIGAATAQAWTSIYLTGGQCQRINATSGATSQGVYTNSVTASIGTPAVAYAWCRVSGGGDQFTITLRDGSANAIGSAKVLTVDDTNGVADKTVLDSFGNTWYRISFTGTNTTAGNFRIYFQRNSGDASAGSIIFIDNVYLEINQTVVPDAWCSTSAIRNRYDPTSSNPERINYFDLWSIPGDAAALTLFKLYRATFQDANKAYIGAGFDGLHPINEQAHWIEGESFTVGGVWSSVADASRSNGNYLRYTNSSGIGNTSYSFTGDSALAFTSGKRRVFALCKTSQNTINATISVSAGTVKANVVNASLGWTFLDFGVINAVGVLNNDGPGTPSFTLTLNISGATSTNTFDVDFFYIAPISNGFMYIEDSLLGSSGASRETWINGNEKRVINNNNKTVATAPGRLWAALPGDTVTRYSFVFIDTLSNVTLSAPTVITAQITPRTRHLLGTS